MKPHVLVSISFLLLLARSTVAFAATPISDDRAIRGLVEAWEKDWNAHDMNAMGALVAENADFVNVAGLHWQGREQIVREHAERHRSNLKLSHWTTKSIAIQKLSREFALVHIDWGMTGDTDFDGTPREPHDGVFTWLVVKQNGHWLMRAVQNTNVTPRK